MVSFHQAIVLGLGLALVFLNGIRVLMAMDRDEDAPPSAWILLAIGFACVVGGFCI